MLERRFNTPLTSSVGRLFDAVAALAGVRDRVSFEGQAAMQLEWLALETAADGAYPFELTPAAPGSPEDVLVVDTRPLIRAVARDRSVGVGAPAIARRFHSTLVEITAAVCARVRNSTGLSAVVLSGGVFMNVLLTRVVAARLDGEGFHVYRHRLVPPNDGGLSLGQLAIAARQAT
jgi:hydrogenase maturation protein HypF